MWTIKELADIAGGRAPRPSAVITGFRSVEQAGDGDLAFVTSRRWFEKLKPGAAAIVPPDLEQDAAERPIIVADSPRLAFARILDVVARTARPAVGIDSRAAVAESAQIGAGVSIGPLAYVGSRAKIGDRTIIHPGAHVGEDAVIGEDCALHPHSYIAPRSIVGNRVIVGPGSCIGHDGFGYQWDGRKHIKVPQVGVAIIEDDVEIGALCAVDRAMLDETRIGAGTKLDNLVHVAHNCRIGQNVILVAQVGLAGGVIIDDNAILAGQVGVADGLHIGKGAVIVAQSGVARDVPAGARMGGYIARPESVWLRSQVLVEKLPNMLKRIKELEERIEQLEGKKPNRSV